ncbi:aquaporin [Sulfolobus sp. B5]|nr:aquaporin [Sulfolobus sp. B5]
MASEVVRDSLWRYFAEFVGTFILILFGDGAVVASLVTNGTSPGYGFIMISWGFGVVLAIYAVGPISGAHINPNVTLAFAVTKRMKWGDVIPYILFQTLGAAAAAGILLAWWGNVIVKMDPPPTLYAQVGASFFTEYPNPFFWGQYWPSKLLLPNSVSGTSLYSEVNQVFPLWIGAFAELLMTFLLLLIVLAVTDADSPFFNQSLAPWAIGIGYVMPFLLFEAQLTGGMINEARSWGPMLALYLFGYRSGAFNFRGQYFFVYGIPDFIGGILGALFWDCVLKPYLKYLKSNNKK